MIYDNYLKRKEKLIVPSLLQHVCLLDQIQYCQLIANILPEENLAKSKSSMLPESKMDSDYTIHCRKH